MSSDAPMLIDLSTRIKIRVTGPDRVRYLNGQITNDVLKATAERAVHAAVLNAKGRMNAELFVHASDDAFVLDADFALRDALGPRLERYIIADDVELEDITERFALLHYIGDSVPELGHQVRAVASNRFGQRGADIWFDAAHHNQLVHDFAPTCLLLDDQAAERFRIERGIPRWGAELTDAIIPVEANLEATAIDYGKGCYIGQEVVSRMKISGQTNKRLCGVVPLDSGALHAGMRLFEQREASREVGWITSATRSEKLGKTIALAFVKRGHNSGGQQLYARDDQAAGTAVEVVTLPFH